MTRLPGSARRRAPLLAALAVACGGGPPASPPATVDPPVRVALAAPPATLDPHVQDDAITHSVLWNAFESLTAFDADMGIEPALALRWESVDDLTWRFPLRPGVRFHDGRPLTAGDVVASLERARRHPDSKTASYLVAVASVAAVDAGTVEVRTRRPTPLLLAKLAFIAVLPAAWIAAADGAETPPPGTGPYRLAVRPDGGLDLVAFTEHWAGAPAVERLRLDVVPDGAERRRRLLAGEVDLVPRLRPADAAAVAASPRHRVEGRSGLSVAYLGMRPDRPPFDDPRVREAVDVALDRDALVRELLAGHGEPRGQMVDRNVYGYDPGLPPPAPNPATARRLLAAAGHPRGVDVELEHRDGMEVAPIVAQLAAAGIRVRPVARRWDDLLARLAAGDVAFYLGGYTCPTGDASDLLEITVHSPDGERGYGRGNHFGSADPAIDRLIEESGATLDMNERRPLLQAALRALAAHHVLVPLHSPRHLHGVAAELAWTPRTDGFLRARDLRWRPPA